MIVLRPIRLADLEPLVRLLDRTTFGLTTLPSDRELLQERILESLHSFLRQPRKPGGETYLFVLDDQEAARLMGTCGVISKVGGFEPFYAYRLETDVRESKILGIRSERRVLHLVREHSGPSEIGSLFLAPPYRRGGLGRFLSLARFVFMAEFRECFEPIVIAEMRGVIDHLGRAPFWEALGRHFFDIDYPKADYLSMKDKRFIAELMPVHPIYITLLPQEAQEVIGQVHPETRPALRLLEGEGFRFGGMVDIFEGGPILQATLDEIRTIQESRKEAVGEMSEEELSGETCILANTSLDFRACLGTIAPLPGGGVRVPKAVASALDLHVGDPVRYAPLRPRKV